MGVRVYHYNGGREVGDYDHDSREEFTDCTPPEYFYGLVDMTSHTKNGDPHYNLYLIEVDDQKIVFWVERVGDRTDDGFHVERWAMSFERDGDPPPNERDQVFAAMKIRLGWFVFRYPERARGTSATTYANAVQTCMRQLDAKTTLRLTAA